MSYLGVHRKSMSGQFDAALSLIIVDYKDECYESITREMAEAQSCIMRGIHGPVSNGYLYGHTIGGMGENAISRDGGDRTLSISTLMLVKLHIILHVLAQSKAQIGLCLLLFYVFATSKVIYG